MWPKKQWKQVNHEDGGDLIRCPADKKNKLVAVETTKNQETQTHPLQFATGDDLQTRPKRKSCGHRCCKKQHHHAHGPKPTDSQRQNADIWFHIFSWLPDLCCFDDGTTKKTPKRRVKHCSDKGLLPGSPCKDPEPRQSDATPPPANKGKNAAGQETGRVPDISTTVVPLTLEGDATKLPDVKSCPCKGRPVWTEFLRPPKPKKKCKYCNKLMRR